MNPEVEKLINFINNSNQIVVFTGAGISTESGISDYRSKGGLWKKFQPVTIQEFLSSEDKRKEYWRIKSGLFEDSCDAIPNAGHLAVVTLERMGKLKGIITQNIDGLHQLAGSNPDKILELHGTMREVICLSCGDLHPAEEIFKRVKEGEGIPHCRLCNGFLKPNTISFGQNLDPVVLETAFQWAQECDCVLALGSTLVVEPAASIPRIAKQNNASLIIITLSETPLDNQADSKIESSIGETLSEALNALNKEKI